MRTRYWITGCLALLGLCIAPPAFAADSDELTPLPQAEIRNITWNELGFRELSDEEYSKLVEIKTRPKRSPITGQVVHVPIEDPKSETLDSDLCPHPEGKVQFFSGIVLCPYTGFAAYRKDFQDDLSPELRAWVQQKLTPRFKAALQEKVKGLKATPEMIQEFFSKQENLPDPLRCEHAFAYYRKKGEPASIQARLAWLCAWSFRREICRPLNAPGGLPVMESMRKLLKVLNKENIEINDLQGRVNLLATMFNDKARYNEIDRMVMRMLMAGYYQRMGMPRWAASSLESVLRDMRTPAASPMQDPFVQCVAGSLAKRQELAQMARKFFDYHAQVKLLQVQRERHYLQMAANLIREGLEKNQYPPEGRAFFIYLVGEFERRSEQFPEAATWLTTASDLLDEIGEPNYAADQLALLQEYVQALGVQVNMNYKTRAQDLVLIQQQARFIRSHYARESGDIRASVPPKTPHQY